MMCIAVVADSDDTASVPSLTLLIVNLDISGMLS